MQGRHWSVIWGGGEYILPDGFLFKKIQKQQTSKEIHLAEHEYMNMHPPAPHISSLATTLVG
jgi:hypothetical protein